MLELHLRSGAKTKDLGALEVRAVRTEAEIRQWVNKVDELHRTTKPTAQVFKLTTYLIFTDSVITAGDGVSDAALRVP